MKNVPRDFTMVHRSLLAEDDDGNPLLTLVHNGCHLVLKERLSAEEETALRAFIDECRTQGISPAKMMAAFAKTEDETP
jgi:hypothetical protein